MHLLLNASLFFLLHAAGANDSVYTLTGRAQGTTYSIRYRYPSAVMTMWTADSIFKGIDASLSTYSAGSLISQFNQSLKGIEADSHLVKMVLQSRRFSKMSDGAFDITVKPLMELWGFGTGTAHVSAPSHEAVVNALHNCGMEKISVHGMFIRKKKPGVRIDCNGIAQGYTVDVLADYLKNRGVVDFMVELGGEIRLNGMNDDKRPWIVGIEQPDSIPGRYRLAGTFQPGTGAVTSSGVYRNQRKLGNRNIPHLIDPATGYPINNGMVSVTVWAADATTADAMDNVLMVIGPSSILQFLAEHPGIEAYWQYILPDGRLGSASTKGFPQVTFLE